MAVYMVFNEQITDQAKFDTYRQQAGPLISRYGGRFLVRGGHVSTLEGDPGLHRVAIIEFDDMAAARRFYDSDEYGPLIRLRQSASIGYAAIMKETDPDTMTALVNEDAGYSAMSVPRWNRQSPRTVRPGTRLHSTKPSRAKRAVTGSAHGVSGMWMRAAGCPARTISPNSTSGSNSPFSGA